MKSSQHKSYILDKYTKIPVLPFYNLFNAPRDPRKYVYTTFQGYSYCMALLCPANAGGKFFLRGKKGGNSGCRYCSVQYSDKKENKIFLVFEEIHRDRVQSHLWLTASSYIMKYLRISAYIRKPFIIINDFAPDPIWISLLCRWLQLAQLAKGKKSRP